MRSSLIQIGTWPPGTQTPARVASAPRQRSAAERHIINPWSWQDAFGFTQANEVTRAGRTIFCAGQTSVDEDGRPVHAGDIRAQLERSLDNLELVLEGAGAGMGDVVRLNYSRRMSEPSSALGRSSSNASPAECRTASTLLGVQTLAFPELLVEIEATAVVGP